MGRVKKVEIWKDIEGYCGFYQVSSLGRVRSLDRTVKMSKNCYADNKKIKGIILSPNKVGRSYQTVVLAKSGKNKTIRVCRLVAKHFIPNQENKPQVDHINNIPYDDRVENLRWVTQSENLLYIKKQNKSAWSSMRKPVICTTNGKEFDSITSASLEYNIPTGNICKVLKSERKKAKGLCFVYKV